MRLGPFLFTFLALAALRPALAEAPSNHTGTKGYILTVADGQILSRDIVVRVTPDLPDGAEPELFLDNSWAADGKPLELPLLGLGHDQVWTETNSVGTQISRSGTIAWYRVPAAMRPSFLTPQGYAMPRLQWRDGNTVRVVMLEGRKAVGFGNLSGGWFWTGILTLGTALALAMLARASGRSPSAYLHDTLGYWSLSSFQILLWTLASGAVVSLLALMRLQLPSIPDSLVILMGLSLATAGGSALLTKAPVLAPIIPTTEDGDGGEQPAAGLIEPPSSPWEAVAGMVYEGPRQLSLARGQMLFWTVIMVAVFLVKSVSDGIVWEVPWQMVALMGLSQAGYLASKKVSG